MSDALTPLHERGRARMDEVADKPSARRKALARGLVRRQERVVVVCTGSGLKSISTLPAPPETRIASARDIARTR
jgi:molybdenum cofactor biosynthesis enzyme